MLNKLIIMKTKAKFKKIYAVKYFFLPAILAGIIIILPLAPVFANQITTETISANAEGSLEVGSYSEVKPASTDASDSIFPILITSIIILGILIFAMWQTFKSKRQI